MRAWEDQLWAKRRYILEFGNARFGDNWRAQKPLSFCPCENCKALAALQNQLRDVCRQLGDSHITPESLNERLANDASAMQESSGDFWEKCVPDSFNLMLAAHEKKEREIPVQNAQTESSEKYNVRRFGLVPFPVGEYVGSGAYSVCYADKFQPEKYVWVIGDAKCDATKHQVYKALGFDVEIRQTSQQTERGNSIVGAKVPRLRNFQTDDSAACQIDSMVDWFDAQWWNARDSEYGEQYDDLEAAVCAYIAHNEDAPKHLREFFSWALDRYWEKPFRFDNHCGNWLVDSDGKAYPTDLILM